MTRDEARWSLENIEVIKAFSENKKVKWAMFLYQRNQGSGVRRMKKAHPAQPQPDQHPIKLVYVAPYCQFLVLEQKLKLLSENQRILYDQQEKILKTLAALQQRASWRGWQ